jgi:cytochrome c553
VSQNTNNPNLPPIVNICFGCHNQKLSAGVTPWAVDWTFASPTASCAKCHQHAQTPPRAVICR